MKKLIERDLFSKLTSWINQKEIFIIIGPRQAGKTTLFLMLKDFLIKKRKQIQLRFFIFLLKFLRFVFNLIKTQRNLSNPKLKISKEKFGCF